MGSLLCTRGQPCTLGAPTSTGGPVTEYSITPALPSGMSLSSSSGALSGSPSVVSPLTNHVVTARNAGGSTSTTLSTTVNDVPPASLTYATNPATYHAGIPIAVNVPLSSGGAVVSYTSGGLPPGLSLDSGTGSISGTPSQLGAAADFTVRATNTGGWTEGVLKITVIAPPAPTIVTQPKGVVVQKTHSATFTVQASGTLLQYQWYRDGVVIPGATQWSYTLSAVAASDEGARFRVVVNDPFGGSVTSASARLTLTWDLVVGANMGDPWSVWGTGPTDVWIGGAGGLSRWNGASWTAYPLSSSVTVRSIWGSAASDVWAAIGTGVARWNGASWSVSALPGTVTGIWGAGPSDVWAVGYDSSGTYSAIRHWDETGWTFVPGMNGTMVGDVWGSASNDVWVTVSGSMLHWDSHAWADSGTVPGYKNGIWGSGPKDVYAASCAPEEAVHWDGTSWSTVPFPASDRVIQDVWGFGPDDVWFVGDGTFHWDGTNLTEVGTPSPSTLRAVWGTPGDVWAVGSGGVVLHRPQLPREGGAERLDPAR